MGGAARSQRSLQQTEGASGRYNRVYRPRVTPFLLGRRPRKRKHANQRVMGPGNGVNPTAHKLTYLAVTYAAHTVRSPPRAAPCRYPPTTRARIAASQTRTNAICTCPARRVRTSCAPTSLHSNHLRPRGEPRAERYHTAAVPPGFAVHAAWVRDACARAGCSVLPGVSRAGARERARTAWRLGGFCRERWAMRGMRAAVCRKIARRLRAVLRGYRVSIAVGGRVWTRWLGVWLGALEALGLGERSSQSI